MKNVIHVNVENVKVYKLMTKESEILRHQVLYKVTLNNCGIQYHLFNYDKRHKTLLTKWSPVPWWTDITPPRNKVTFVNTVVWAWCWTIIPEIPCTPWKLKTQLHKLCLELTVTKIQIRLCKKKIRLIKPFKNLDSPKTSSSQISLYAYFE